MDTEASVLPQPSEATPLVPRDTASCMLLLGSRWKTPAILDRIPFRRIVSFLADTSYGVYLSHMLVLLPMAAFLLRHPAYTHLPAPARFSVLMLAVSSICYPLAF